MGMAKDYKDMVYALDIGTHKVMVVAAEVVDGEQLRLDLEALDVLPQALEVMA